MTTPVQAPQPARPKLPAGLRWSNVWRTADGTLVEGERELPVDRNWHISARLYLCPTKDCATEEWVTGTDEQHPPCCPRHPVTLIEVAADQSSPNPVAGARARLVARIREVVAQRRQRTVDALTRQAEAARAAAAIAAKRTAADMRGHVPTLSATAAVMLGGSVAAAADPVATALAGAALATAGAVAAYVAVYAIERWRAREALIGRAGRRARVRARHVATGLFAAGLWLIAEALVGVDPLTLPPLLLAGALGSWVVNRSHWDDLWAARRRLKDLARQKSEEAARRAEEAARNATAGKSGAAGPSATEVIEGPIGMGRRMAARWAEIARADTVPVGFLMRRTRVLPEETRELTVPDGDQIVRVGWEYAIESEPGVLVARFGSASPLLAARDWLASMLGVHPSLVSLVDRPDNLMNRALLSITDRLALGNAVAWKGPDSLRRQNGVILGHVGADMKGQEIYEPIHVPGQLTGGLTVGHSGGGKSSGARVSLLNDLAAGVFPVVYDPVKSLGDFSEFAGIFPMGCTPEHRDVLLQSLHAERHRRNKAINGRMMTDRFDRVRPEPAAFQVGRDGPPLRSYWDEFHRNAADKVFLASFLDLMRVQRAVAMSSEVYTQGGGLQDLGDSVVRGLLNQVRMRLYRMPDNLARLAGYNGDYMPSHLPRVPGACLVIAEGVPVIPLRGGWVSRDDEDGCVYDHLYAPDGTPLLTAPRLPEATLALWERTGLMDLWRLGQGPNGLTNLLGDNSFTPTAAAAGVADGGAAGSMKAADVLLAIVHGAPGCARSVIDDHQAWASAPGWGKSPAPSTISRAAAELEKVGLLTREGGQYRVTDAGEARARAAAGQLASLRDGQSPTDVERQQEAGAEARDAAEVTA